MITFGSMCGTIDHVSYIRRLLNFGIKTGYDRAHHHAKNIMIIPRPLEMLHMDLFGSIANISIGGNKYGLVVVDAYSRFTWVFFCRIRVKLKRC
jgi:hypothetical protein